MVNKSNKEGEYYVNCKKAIDDVIHKKDCAWQVSPKCKFKWADPGRVENQDYQEFLP